MGDFSVGSASPQKQFYAHSRDTDDNLFKRKRKSQVSDTVDAFELNESDIKSGISGQERTRSFEKAFDHPVFANFRAT
jgi:hypothetical protein